MSADDECTLYCSNLSEKVTERILYELFMQAGPVKDVRIPTSNGKPRSFGFVIFKHECSVTYAARLMNNTMLYGKCISVRPSKGSNNRMERAGPNQERLEFPDCSSLRGLGRDVRKRPQDDDMMPCNLGKRLCGKPDSNVSLNSVPHTLTYMLPGIPGNNFPLMSSIPCNLYPSQSAGFNGSVKYSNDHQYYDRDRGRDRNNDRSYRNEDRFNDYKRDKQYIEKHLYPEERNHNRERNKYDKRHNEMYSRGNDRHNDRNYSHRSHRR